MVEGFTAAVAVVTVLLALSRPGGINEGWWALLGATLMILTGRISILDALDALTAVSGVFLFLIGLFWVTLAADRAGVFQRAARLTVRAAGGDGLRLILAVFAFGTLTTGLLSNDATVLLLTPVIFRVCRLLDLPPLPYVLSCSFVADTASGLLPISNPINLLFAERFDLSFQRHVALLTLPTLVAVLVNAAIFVLVFRNEIPRHFDAAMLTEEALEPPGRYSRLAIWGLAGLGLGYFVAAAIGFDPYWVTLAGGALSAVLGLVYRRFGAVDLIRAQPLSLYVFVASLAVLVASVERAGLLDGFGQAISSMSELGDGTRLIGVVLGTALGANVVNNWTMAISIIPPLQQAHAGDVLVAGSMLGADIGPNLTILGSLATVIWLTELRRNGLEVSAWTLLRLGILASLPALIAATLVLYLLSWIT